MIVRRGFGCVVKSSSTLLVFNRFWHGKFICLFVLFLLVGGRVPRSLFRIYGLNFSVVVTCHCAQPNDFRSCPGSCFLRYNVFYTYLWPWPSWSSRPTVCMNVSNEFGIDS